MRERHLSCKESEVELRSTGSSNLWRNFLDQLGDLVRED